MGILGKFLDVNHKLDIKCQHLETEVWKFQKQRIVFH